LLVGIKNWDINYIIVTIVISNILSNLVANQDSVAAVARRQLISGQIMLFLDYL